MQRLSPQGPREATANGAELGGGAAGRVTVDSRSTGALLSRPCLQGPAETKVDSRAWLAAAMGDPGGGHGDGAPSLTRTLNRDALEEVFLHCDPSDLLALRATCKLAARLLDDSEKVWLTKLRESYRLHLKVRWQVPRSDASLHFVPGMLTDVGMAAEGLQGATVSRSGTHIRKDARYPLRRPQAVTPSAYGVFLRLARHVFEASPAQQLRFQGVFVNGGVDEASDAGREGAALEFHHLLHRLPAGGC